ncbi:MAG: molybdopterin biosynthesis protein [Planctomycetes bacterium RBG_16_64_10]|nr:MAG: molybdopterin biosynthesis protein [Planctomycetes bacterium RBG_16_64_10]
MSAQEQFLEVIDRDEAERRFQAALRLEPLEAVDVGLAEALGRVLAADIAAEVDVPSFDRSNYDGFAVCAADTYGAHEEGPRRLALQGEPLATGSAPSHEVVPGTACQIATGGVVPRGADAVVMVEDAEVQGHTLLVHHPVTPGFGITFAGTDIAAGETVLRRGDRLTSRETGVLAAIGRVSVPVHRQVTVAICSTGDEIIPPGEPMRPGQVYDSNGQILADAVRELGAQPIRLGIVGDDLDQLRQAVRRALERADVVLFSGGTSKGQGDLSYRVLGEMTTPGIVVHGVALKPGKPICLAAHHGKPLVILPGFPTSAVFTFHEFVAPIIRRLAGGRPEPRHTTQARLAVQVRSEFGRTEYLLVGLVKCDPTQAGQGGLMAYPMGQGSGSVTAFSRADGFVTIGRHEELLAAGADVTVQLIGSELHGADLVVMGSHCVGLDYLIGQISALGFRVTLFTIGSTAGLAAAQRAECDLTGMHLLDAATGQYNRPFLSPDLELIPGYGRQQGVVFRRGDERFAVPTAAEAAAAAIRDTTCVMVNRNQGSGTRILIDGLLQGARPAGYAVQARNHNAVAAAIVQGRADWGVAIQSVAQAQGLGFLPLCAEQYDFVVPRSRGARPAVVALRRLLQDPAVRARLRELGLQVPAAMPDNAVSRPSCRMV